MLTPLAFGMAPFGFAAFGYGDPVASASFVVASAPVRALDPVARDYARDGDSLAFLPMGDLAQRVLLALATRRGELLLDRTFGNAVIGLDRTGIDPRWQVQRLVEQALARLLAGGDVELEGVDVDVRPGQLGYVVRWRDVRARASRVTGGVI